MDLVENSFRLQDRTAIITGEVDSINQALGRKLTQLGTDVAFIHTTTDRAQKFCEQLMNNYEVNDKFGKAIAIKIDLAKPANFQDSISKVAESFGGIDILIDNMSHNNLQSFKDANSLDGLDQFLNINLKAPLFFTHAALKFLESRKRGRVIYLLPDLARMGLQKNSMLAASRTSLIHFSKSLAREVQASNITVNCVASGLSEEFVLSQKLEAKSLQAGVELMQKSHPEAQLMDSEKIANLVAFLASPLAAGLTGQTIAVNQGLSMMA
jgi:3-oxoacyl-[acyl-carrier protein] reductase